ncbi:hypothetical protein WH47_10926 [Habropoda laboriosa]|uniref:CCHC-type domain-containing protein n=1 Tax=Habropoda laboriosa TaxID=597456 RepID=A0A0L7QKL8_9HYME|nr:hypothetical protein WH47_10926 [Habropoda laboriosa]
MCYECWRYGHLSKYCKSMVDRSKCCFLCVVEGHNIEKSTSELCCILTSR